MPSKSFKSAFNTVYNVKIKCPSCKEEIFAHAKKCPYCHVDLTSVNYVKSTKWQEKANIVLLVIVGLIVLSMIFSSVNIIVSIGLGIVLYGLGYFVVLKIQSFFNSMK